ncbi:hypothetical protein ACFWB2_26235 [Streptomyces virginiae]|uniref:hypothetical protein n=1 Tax=Streptomyces virginiae TaxID=1961 RepID=UPI002252CB50|nr:hypothetical protein [Streptomyces virginiae]MCX5272598.1 hypothetical protein [Streptomyces virginiae]WSC78773.1 hypothetical protein OHA56_22095 [Streptomyces virginiae]
MSGRHHARSAPARALTVVCVVLLCVFGAGPAGAAAAEFRPASAAPAMPAAPGAPAESPEGPSDPAPAPDPEARAAVRTITRGLPGVRRTPLAVFHVEQPGAPACAPAAEAAEPALSRRPVRSVVLRC